MAEQLESWTSSEYGPEWAGDDVVAKMLDLPRKISAAVVADAGVEPTHVIDLGSGPAAYLALFLERFPGARGTWTDVSDAMRELAQEKLDPFGDRVAYALVDLEQPGALELERADVIITSRVLHHFSPETLQQLYARVYDALVPGGFFFNLDHIGPPGDWEQRYRRIRPQFTGARKQALKPHRQDYPFARVDDHLEWLRGAGFESPDTPWRTFYTALLAGRKPS